MNTDKTIFKKGIRLPPFRYMERGLFLVFLLCLPEIIFSQVRDRKIDSLTQILKTSKEDTSKVNSLIALSKIFSSSGNFNQALGYSKDALSLADKLNFRKGIINSYDAIANVYVLQGNDAETLSNLFSALKAVEKTGDKDQVVIAYSKIGGFYLGHNSYADALKNFLEALRISKEIGNDKYMAACYLNIGVIYQLQGNYNEALKNYLASLKIKEKTGDKTGVAKSYVNMGDLYLKLGQWTDAKVYIHKGLLLSQQANSEMGIAASYINLGELYIHLQKLPTAKEYLKKGLQLSKEIRSREYVKETYYNLSIIDSFSGNYKGAYQYYQQYTLMKDSIQNIEAEKQISQLTIKYETEKKDKDILLLNKNDEIKTVKIEEQKTFIIYLVCGFILIIIFTLIYFRLNGLKRRSAFRHKVLETEMKALRSQMNPHFTFNVLNSIQYFISENDMDSAELYIEKFSSLIRMILDQSRTAYITLEQEINILKLYLELEEMRFEKKFNYAMNIDSNIDPRKILIPGMLMQPIVENAIKHGIEHKEGNCLITISFSTKDSVLICTVTDNGIGREAAEKLNGGKIHKSTATSIIKERIEALSSIYNIELSYKTKDLFNEDGSPEGTCVSMEIPVGIKNEELSAELVNQYA